MKTAVFVIVSLFIIGLIIYVTFIIAVIKIVFGLILLGISAVILTVIYFKIKHRLED